MKVFNRFRKIFMGLLFPYRTFRNHRSSRGRNPGSSFPRRRSCDRPEPPKNSCSSSYYSSNSHYDEAISDCIEFFNKSSREGALDTKTSGFMVWYYKYMQSTLSIDILLSSFHLYILVLLLHPRLSIIWWRMHVSSNEKSEVCMLANFRIPTTWRTAWNRGLNSSLMLTIVMLFKLNISNIIQEYIEFNKLYNLSSR